MFRSVIFLESLLLVFVWSSVFLICFAIFPMMWVHPPASIPMAGLGGILLAICYFLGTPYVTNIEPYSYYSRGFFDVQSIGTGNNASYYYAFNGMHLRQPKALSLLVGRLAHADDGNGYKPAFHCRLARYEQKTRSSTQVFYVLLNVNDFYCIDTLYSSKKPLDFVIPTFIWLLQALYYVVFYLLLFFGIAITIAVFTGDKDYYVYTCLANIILGGVILFTFPNVIKSMLIDFPTPLLRRLRCDHKHHFR